MAKQDPEEIKQAIQQKRELAEHHETEARSCLDPTMRETHLQLALDYREDEERLEAKLGQSGTDTAV